MKIDKYHGYFLLAWSSYIILFPIQLVLYLFAIIGDKCDSLGMFIADSTYSKYDRKWQERHWKIENND